MKKCIPIQVISKTCSGISDFSTEILYFFGLVRRIKIRQPLKMKKMVQTQREKNQ